MQTLEHFHREAVKNNLSAGAILLWQQLYFTMKRKGEFCDVQQSTAVLMAQLKVTRQGLAVMRQTLVERGFLNVRVDEHQQSFYTLMLEGKMVGSGTAKTIDKHNNVGAGSLRPQIMDISQSVTGTGNPSPTTVPQNDTVASHPSGDIVLTNRIRPYIDAFCDKFGPAMKGDLIQWAEMRRKNGWTLTIWGLEELFKKLINLSAGNAVEMGRIVAQSVTRRWKGFFALKAEVKPSGEALRKEERRNELHLKPWEKSASWQKFKPEERDLSFLEI